MPDAIARSRSRLPVLQCIAAAALFGIATPASKWLLDSVSPVTLAGLLYLGAAGAVVPAAWHRRENLRRLDRPNLLRAAGAVLFGGFLGPVLLLWGLSVAPAASVALWLNLETVATALLAWLWFKDHLTRRVWVAAAIIFGASILLALPFDIAAGLPALLVAAACLCWGLDNHLTALIDRLSPAQTTFVKGLAAGSVNVAIGLGMAQSGPPTVGAIGWSLTVGAVCYGASLVLYIGGAQQLGATRSQLLFATAPFWGVLVSWIWFWNAITPMQAAATGIMLVAVWLLNTERHAHAHAHARLTHSHLHRHDEGHHGHRHGRMPRWGWHSHAHTHEPATHEHPHVPDLHHRHDH